MVLPGEVVCILIAADDAEAVTEWKRGVGGLSHSGVAGLDALRTQKTLMLKVRCTAGIKRQGCRPPIAVALDDSPGVSVPRGHTLPTEVEDELAAGAPGVHSHPVIQRIVDVLGDAAAVHSEHVA